MGRVFVKGLIRCSLIVQSPQWAMIKFRPCCQAAYMAPILTNQVMTYRPHCECTTQTCSESCAVVATLWGLCVMFDKDDDPCWSATCGIAAVSPAQMKL